MKKKIIPCEVRNEQVIGAGVVVGAEGSGNDVILQLHFGQSWDGLIKYVTFRDALGENEVVTLLTEDMKRTEIILPPPPIFTGPKPPFPKEPEEEPSQEKPQVIERIVYHVPIPGKAKAVSGKMMATVQGYELSADGSQVEVATMTATAYFRVLPSGYSMPEDESITTTISQQLQNEIEYMIKNYLKLNAENKAEDFELINGTDQQKRIYVGTDPMISLSEFIEAQNTGRMLRLKPDGLTFHADNLEALLKAVKDQVENGTKVLLVLSDPDGGPISLRGLAAPEEDTDAANKKYVDESAENEAERADGEYMKLSKNNLSSSIVIHPPLPAAAGSTPAEDTSKTIVLRPTWVGIQIRDGGNASTYPTTADYNSWMVQIARKSMDGSTDLNRVMLSPDSLWFFGENSSDEVKLSQDGDGLKLSGVQGNPIPIRGVSLPTADGDAANKKYVDDTVKTAGDQAAEASEKKYLKLSGGTMEGDLELKGGLNDTPDISVINQDSGDFACLGAGIISLGRDQDRDGSGDNVRIVHSSGKLSLAHSHGFDPDQPVLIQGVKAPVKDTDAVNKKFVEDLVKDAVGLTEAQADERYLQLAGGTMTVKSGTSTFNAYVSPDSVIFEELKGEENALSELHPDGLLIGTSGGSASLYATQDGEGALSLNSIKMSSPSESGSLLKIVAPGNPASPVTLRGIAAPEEDDDAANKEYVDEVSVSGIKGGFVEGEDIFQSLLGGMSAFYDEYSYNNLIINPLFEGGGDGWELIQGESGKEIAFFSTEHGDLGGGTVRLNDKGAGVKQTLSSILFESYKYFITVWYYISKEAPISGQNRLNIRLFHTDSEGNKVIDATKAVTVKVDTLGVGTGSVGWHKVGLLISGISGTKTLEVVHTTLNNASSSIKPIYIGAVQCLRLPVLSGGDPNEAWLIDNIPLIRDTKKMRIPINFIQRIAAEEAQRQAETAQLKKALSMLMNHQNLAYGAARMEISSMSTLFFSNIPNAPESDCTVYKDDAELWKYVPSSVYNDSISVSSNPDAPTVISFRGLSFPGFRINFNSQGSKIRMISFGTWMYDTLASLEVALRGVEDLEVSPGAFDGLTQIKSVKQCFVASGLKTIPADLFKKNKILDYSACFMECKSLVLRDDIFPTSFSYAVKGDTIDFSNCFFREEYTGDGPGQAPELWNMTFPSGVEVIKTGCFGGAGNNAESISNYADIPEEWK